MTIWDLGWIMMLLAARAQQWSTVQMVKGWSTAVLMFYAYILGNIKVRSLH